MTTLKPPLAAMHASVPIASSASMPGTVRTGQPSSLTASWIGSICSARSSGIDVRVALYSGYQSSRKVLPLASNTQAPCAAGYCSRSSFIIDDHAADRAGRNAAGAAQVGQRVIGAVEVARAVDEQQGPVHHAAPL